MLACLLATRAASIERLLAVGQLLSSGCLLCWCAGQLPDDCSSNTVRCGYLFAVFYTLRSYISAAADTVFLWEAAPTNGNARRGCPAQPTRYFWARDCCSAVGRLAAVLPAPRQRRGAPRLESKCRLMNCGRQASSRRAHRSIRLPSDPRAGRDAYFQSVRGAHDSCHRELLRVALPKATSTDVRACAELGRRALATSRPAGQRRKQPCAGGPAPVRCNQVSTRPHRAPSRAARTRCADARRRAP